MRRGFPEGWAEKARVVLGEQAPDLLRAIDGQYRRGLIGAVERDKKLVSATHALAPEGVRRQSNEPSGKLVLRRGNQV